jgi:hypothetical protein
VKDDPSDPSPRIDRASARRYGVQHLMYLVAAFALLFAALVYAPWAALIFAATALPMVLVVGLIALIVNQLGSQQDAMLWAVANAAALRLPLAPGIEAFADLCGGFYRRRSLALASLVHSGCRWPMPSRGCPGSSRGPRRSISGWAGTPT